MRNSKSIALVWAFGLGTATMVLPAAAADQPHNIVLFIPDGLRALMVSGETAPRMATIRDKGVNFKNPHSLFPTFTTPNASAMATGHYLGDTGDFSNIIYSGFPVPGSTGPPRWRRSRTPTTISAASRRRSASSGSPTRPTSS